MKEFIVLLHDIRSLHNVGSVFRTADAAGVNKLYLCGITPTPLNIFGRPEEKLAKVALGAEKYVPWEKALSATKAIEALKKEGFTILALEQSKKSIAYTEFKPKKAERIVLILGNEVKGLPISILKKCDKILEIPMRGAMLWQTQHPKNEKVVRRAPSTMLGINHHKESLNVSVAFGIVAFQLLRKV